MLPQLLTEIKGLRDFNGFQGNLRDFEGIEGMLRDFEEFQRIRVFEGLQGI